MKYATAIHHIHARGTEGAKPGTTFAIEDQDEFNRLEGLNAVRQATADEVALYHMRNKSGESVTLTVKGTAPANVSSEADIAAAKARADAEAKAEEDRANAKKLAADREAAREAKAAADKTDAEAKAAAKADAKAAKVAGKTAAGDNGSGDGEKTVDDDI